MIFANYDNLKTVNSRYFQGLVRKVSHEYKKGFNSLYANIKAVWMNHVKLLTFKV